MQPWTMAPFGHFDRAIDAALLKTSLQPAHEPSSLWGPLSGIVDDSPETRMGLPITPLTPLTPATPFLEKGIPTRRFGAHLAGPDFEKAPGNLSPSPSPNSGPFAIGSIPRGKRSPRKPITVPWKFRGEAATPAVPVKAKKKKAVAKKEPKQRAKQAKAPKAPKKRKTASPKPAAGSGSEAEETQAYSGKPWKGASLGENQKNWRSQVWNGSSVVYLGTYPTKEEAAIRYDKEVIRLRGPKLEALNFLIENYPDQLKEYEEAQRMKEYEEPHQENAKNLLMEALRLEEEEEAAELKRNTKRQRRTKNQTVAKAAAPPAPAPAPATTAKPTRQRAAADKQFSSKFRGVSWSDRSGKWRTQLCKNGKVKHIGFFTDEIEAAAAYDRAVLKLKVPDAKPASLGEDPQPEVQVSTEELDLLASLCAVNAWKPQDDEATTGAMILVCLSSGDSQQQR